VAALLLLLPWLLVPFMGFFVLVQGSNVPAALVLTAPVSLVQAVRATETVTQGRVVRVYVGTRRRPWGYVLVVERQDGSQRFWVDPFTGQLKARGLGGSNDPLISNALPMADLLEAAEQRAGGRAMEAEGTRIDGRPAVEVHVATAQDQVVEVYLDAYTALVLVVIDRKP
jgi:uncharacterized membrane protein YkoI